MSLLEPHSRIRREASEDKVRSNLYGAFRGMIVKRPNSACGGLHSPHTADGLYQSEPPPTFAACKAVWWGDALNPGVSDPKKIATKLHLNCGHNSAHRLRRVVVDADGGHLGLLGCVDGELRQREVCRAFDNAPGLPAAGTSSVSLLGEELQAGLLFLDDTLALRATGMYPECTLLAQVRHRWKRLWKFGKSSFRGLFSWQLPF